MANFVLLKLNLYFMKFIELVCGGEKYSGSVAHIVAVTPAEGGCMLYLSAALMNRNTLVVDNSYEEVLSLLD